MGYEREPNQVMMARAEGRGITSRSKIS
jgi:hypothetical protein